MISVNKIIFIFCIFFFSCQESLQRFAIYGYTQGTTYSVKYHAHKDLISQSSIDSLLHIIDLSMSAYIPNSTIAKINNNIEYDLDSLISYVLNRSIEICEETNGMFDVTVSPIVNDWGFGPNLEHKKKITFQNYEVGCDKIILQENKLVKNEVVKIDLNGIAQGFSVDYVSTYLLSKGVSDFMVEIGGEVTCAGNNLGDGWIIGVDNPSSKKRSFAYVLKLNDISLATSGSYRNYYYLDSLKVSHTINPKTFEPAFNTLLSATILSSDCISADAYATACMSFGLDDAKKFLNDNGIIGALIYSNNEDTLYYFSDGFSSFLHRSPGSAPQ